MNRVILCKTETIGQGSVLYIAARLLQGADVMAQFLDDDLAILCERASQEHDPKKLVELTQKINALLQERRTPAIQKEATNNKKTA